MFPVPPLPPPGFRVGARIVRGGLGHLGPRQGSDRCRTRWWCHKRVGVVAERRAGVRVGVGAAGWTSAGAGSWAGAMDACDCDCAALRSEVEFWRVFGLVSGGVLVLIVSVNLFLTARRRLIVMNQMGMQAGALGAEADKPWYANMDDQEGDFSDSISDTSSLFSPPFRADQNMTYKSAAAKVSDTHAYIAPSVSTENFNRFYENYDGLDDFIAHGDAQAHQHQRQHNGESASSQQPSYAAKS